MDSLYYKLFQEILSVQSSEELIDLTERVQNMEDPTDVTSELAIMVLQLALLTKGNSFLSNELMEESSSINIVFGADPSFFSNWDELDSEKQQLKLMREEELENLKNDKVYNISSIKKTDKNKD